MNLAGDLLKDDLRSGDSRYCDMKFNLTEQLLYYILKINLFISIFLELYPIVSIIN